MDIKLFTHDEVKSITINGSHFPKVTGYKVITSESGETEVELKFKIDASLVSIEMSSN